MRLMFILFFALFSLTPALGLGPEDVSKAKAGPAAPAQWHLDDIEFLTRDGGRWVASNAEYKNENEPMEAYVLEWKKGYANSMTGHLYGVVDGEPTGDFWQFLQYWHPGLGAVQIQQFGFGGAAGLGEIWREDDVNKTRQIFYGPDGSSREEGHEAHNPDANTHVTTSFDIKDGEWTPRRTYTWRREKN